MSTRYFTERKWYALSALILFVLVLAGCGGKTATNTSSTSVNNTISQRILASPSASVSGNSTAMATLKRQPVGSANLNWSPSDHMLSVQISLSGLAPSSVHPVHINQGSCSTAASASGTVTPGATRALYPLVNITADAKGVVNTTSKVNVPNGIPAKNWYLEVYNGPGLSTSTQATPIACGDIVNHDTSLRSAQSAQVTLGAPKGAANQAASGKATLKLTGHTLVVQLEASGLAPKSEHTVHIHAGSCTNQGSVVYPLTTLTADATGKATSTTTIQNVTTIPSTGWYVNIHNTTDMSTQTGYDPIICGNVTAGNA
ncbi:MAG TPA: CHRD domain-containing protein [Ktedonobacteraceae bacterium]